MNLSVDIPTLEPDHDFVLRLAALSAESAPKARSRAWMAPRILIPAAGLSLAAGTSWLAGAVPGVHSPFGDEAPVHSSPDPSDRQGGDGDPSDNGNGNHNGQNGTQGEGNGGEPNGEANGLDNGNGPKDGKGPKDGRTDQGNHHGQNGTQGEGNGGEPNGPGDARESAQGTAPDKAIREPRNVRGPQEQRGSKD